MIATFVTGFLVGAIVLRVLLQASGRILIAQEMWSRILEQRDVAEDALNETRDLLRSVQWVASGNGHEVETINSEALCCICPWSAYGPDAKELGEQHERETVGRVPEKLLTNSERYAARSGL